MEIKTKNRRIAVSFVFGYNMDKDKQVYSERDIIIIR